MSVSLVNNIHSVGKGIGAVVDCQRYNNLGKLLRVTGYVLRFIKNIRLKMINHELVLGTSTIPGISFAQLQWIKFDQSFMIDSEHFTKIQSTLNLFYDNNSILRGKSRICCFESFTYNKKFPTLLKIDSYFRKLIVLKSREDVCHSGADSTLFYLQICSW